MLGDEIEQSLKVEEVEEYAMTCLGTLVFADKHSRQSLTSSDSSKEQVDSLSLAYEDLFIMPYNIIHDYCLIIQHLDISNNMFSRNLQFLSEFDNLRSVNLDHNKIDDVTIFPNMPNLELLWLNHNCIKNLYPFIKNLRRSVPNLKYLCLMGNEAAPSYLNGGDFCDYLRYRLYVLSWFPRLMHLDDRIVTDQQLLQTKKLFRRSLLEDFVAVPECIKNLHNKIAVHSKPSVSERQKVFSGTNLVV
ncbi:leucine-rich melanocyte differentiation-associated protein isoform X4 [Monomorium pharaonis]|uniref:leucine-rich melanocyte differentiation-associated protein isoform X3 n=1 Tax=Monomorium pharaonis TaxID=307658 RepID=UPI00063F3BD9|nr:leucine-rich melanocyte differentiation-associated protein isoform X3 [Monomorium pharaonis]XP_012530939.1 leucine-rich melanocyte differentiation-associated protein isoform X4 [Monomorium pharaonis]